MSFLFYNPLEAMILIIPIWIANTNNINWKNKKLLLRVFIKDCYIIGTLNLIIQLPLNFLFDTLFYSLYNNIVCFIGMLLSLYFYSRIRFKIKSVYYSFIINTLYFITMPIILSNSVLYLNFILNSTFVNELLINLLVRTIQFVLIIILFGGFFMFKKFLKKTAKNNLTKMVASTAYGVGEPKISEKLKTEVKNSK